MADTSGSLSFEQRLFWLCLSAAFPASLAVLWLLWRHQYSHYLIALIVVFLLLQIGITAYQVKTHIINQFRTLTNLMEALTNGDYSMRGRRTGKTGALSELVKQINGLADLLAKQRFEVRETQLLLGKVINQIDVAVFTFDRNQRLRLVNPAGAKLLGKNQFELLKTSAKSNRLDRVLEHHGEVVTLDFASGTGRYHVATDRFIEDGSPHTLLFITNVQQMLRKEERRAWQNLIRVISHEINNSLTPIASLSQTLMEVEGIDRGHQKESLALINERALSLQTFVDSYHHLAKLPAPNQQAFEIKDLMAQVQTLFPEADIHCHGQPIKLWVDPGQWQQLMLNLVKNAQEAASPQKLTMEVSWHLSEMSVELTMIDNGPGIANPDNLFVPFYTTKTKGSGIGLLLCRNIVEAHGGEIRLTNGENGGCLVKMAFPHAPQQNENP